MSSISYDPNPTSVPLPAGAATEATLSALNAKVTAVNTGAVVVSSSALPANASTETTLSALNGKVIAVNTGAVVVASSALPTGAATETTLATRASESTLSAINGKLNSLGQKTAANSAPVTIASDQSAVPASQSGTWNINNISGTVSLPSGAATSANQATEIASLASIDSKTPALVSGRQPVDGSGVTQPISAAALPLPSGAATEATLSSLNSKVTVVNTGAVVVSSSALPTGAATETTVSAINSKLGTLGQKNMAGSAPITIASDQSTLPVYSPSSVLTLTASFTRPADTTNYATGDLVANSTVAASVVPLTFTNAIRAAGEAIRIERVRLIKSTLSLTNASFKVRLYSVIPVPTVGDNGLFNNAGVLAVPQSGTAGGDFSITMINSCTGGAFGSGTPDIGIGVTLQPTSGTSIFSLIEFAATLPYTPGNSEVFTVVLEGYRS